MVVGMMYIVNSVGIYVFVIGGIGGVYCGVENSMLFESSRELLS